MSHTPYPSYDGFALPNRLKCKYVSERGFVFVLDVGLKSANSRNIIGYKRDS